MVGDGESQPPGEQGEEAQRSPAWGVTFVWLQGDGLGGQQAGVCQGRAAGTHRDAGGRWALWRHREQPGVTPRVNSGPLLERAGWWLRTPSPPVAPARE